MSNRITFKVNDIWKDRTEDLAKRIANIVVGQEDIYKKVNGTYQLGSSNDWWLQYLGDDKYDLVYRYGDDGTMLRLRGALTWHLGIDDLQDSFSEEFKRMKKICELLNKQEKELRTLLDELN